jgi:3-hydroxyisobutyrate dehydrogenase
MTKVALIGTGRMGSGIARRLLQAGFDLTVWNRTASKAEPLIDVGAKWAETPAQAVQDVDFIISMVGDDISSKTVWLGENGILHSQLKEGAFAIENTTLSFEWVNELQAAVTEAKLRYIDCPVTGGPPRAENGTLTLLAGAEEDILLGARPVLDAYSQNIIHFGPPGTGTVYKLLYNLMLSAQLVALAEVILLAEKAGLNMDRVVEGLTTGLGSSPIVKNFTRKLVNSEHDPVRMSLQWASKDADYATKMAASLDHPIPMCGMVAQVYKMALRRGLGEKNVKGFARPGYSLVK